MSYFIHTSKKWDCWSLVICCRTPSKWRSCWMKLGWVKYFGDGTSSLNSLILWFIRIKECKVTKTLPYKNINIRSTHIVTLSWGHIKMASADSLSMTSPVKAQLQSVAFNFFLKPMTMPFTRQHCGRLSRPSHTVYTSTDSPFITVSNSSSWWWQPRPLRHSDGRRRWTKIFSEWKQQAVSENGCCPQGQTMVFI